MNGNIAGKLFQRAEDFLLWEDKRCGKHTCDDDHLYLTSIAYYQKSNTQAYSSTAESLQAKRYGFTHHVCYTLT